MIRFDHFPQFDELSDWLHELAATSNGMMELSSIGESYEGRTIWLATVTNQATGAHSDKPAIWIDGNVHAAELTAATACIHLLHHLVTNYGSDERVTRAVDRRTFYVVPRVDPDGAELALAEKPKIVRSSTRAWPRADQQDGWVSEDFDHDGRLLQMRLEDPNGSWKKMPGNERMLVAREPDEDTGGSYFRLLREGVIEGYDGDTVPVAPLLEGIDSNRNFPNDWRRYPDVRDASPWGAGDFPTSEPEIRAVVQAVVDRPNITTYLAYHTQSGVHLRPFGNQADDAFDTSDLRAFEALGTRMTAITGYPAVSVYQGFRYDPKDVITGTGSDWAFDHRGVFAWTTEFWSPLRTAGIVDPHPIDWHIDHPIDEELQLLAWVEENAPEGFVDWYPVEHPQLGPVELGGWDHAAVFRNPPRHLLEAEVAPHTQAALFLALSAPELRLRSAGAERLDHETWRIRLVVENAGWMPTNVTRKAIERRVAQPVEATIELPDAVVLLTGTPTVDLGHLGGRAGRTSSLGYLGNQFDGTADRAKAEWVVQAPAGTVVALRAGTPRAGVVTASVTLT